MMKIRQLIGFVALVVTSAAFFACQEKQELIFPEDTGGNVVIKVNGVSFKMIKVEGDVFRMGSDGYLFDVVEDETPTHNVLLSTFYIAETEVTQELWNAVMIDNPSSQTGSDRLDFPVETVSWDDCQAFIDSLNAITGRKFSLPTEAQWEYAARGGIKKNDYFFSGSDNATKVCWYSENSLAPREVKGKEANKLGIYDMSGNVAEWCSDWYGPYYAAYQENPEGQATGTARVVRGGAWNSLEKECRNTARSSQAPEYKSSAIGFRLAMVD